MSVIVQEYIETGFAGVLIGKKIKSGILEYADGCGKKTSTSKNWSGLE